jgi:hypothetical protein
MKRSFILAVIVSLVALPSCSSDPDVWRGQAGGAMVGGVAGGLITDSWGGAAVGAAMGGLVGGEIARNR